MGTGPLDYVNVSATDKYLLFVAFFFTSLDCLCLKS